MSSNMQTNLDVLMDSLHHLSYEGQIVMTDALESGLSVRRKRVYVFFMNVANPKLDLMARPLAQVFERFRKCITSCVRSPPCASEALLHPDCPEAERYLAYLQTSRPTLQRSATQTGGNWIEQHMKVADSLGIR